MPRRSDADFRGVRERLLRAGIAPRHARRYVRELGDHMADATAAGIAAGMEAREAARAARARIGDDEELARAMIEQPGFRGIAARAPWLVFGILPVPVLLLAMIVCVLPVALVTRLLRHAGETMPSHAPGWYAPVMQGAMGAYPFAVPFCAALCFAWLAWRQRMGGWWPRIGAGLCAVFGACIVTQFSMPQTHDFRTVAGLQWRGRIGVGFAPPLHTVSSPEAVMFLLRIVLTLLPVALAWWAWTRAARGEKEQ